MTSKRTLKELYAARYDFVVRLVNLHAEAHRMGLHITGHVLHEAVQKVGYELADRITKVSAQSQAGGKRRKRERN